MSAFTPALRYARYESRLRRVVLAMFTKNKFSEVLHGFHHGLAYTGVKVKQKLEFVDC